MTIETKIDPFFVTKESQLQAIDIPHSESSSTVPASDSNTPSQVSKIIDSDISTSNILNYSRREASMALLNEIREQEQDPLTYEEEMKSKHKEEWKKAIRKELSNLIK